jgi:hypothetical protein
MSFREWEDSRVVHRDMQCLGNEYRELTVGEIPAAHCVRLGVMRYEIQRPKTAQDKFIAGFKSLSDVCDTPERAWRNSWEKLSDPRHRIPSGPVSAG